MSAGGRKAAAAALKEERLHCVLPRWLGGGLIALGVLVVLVVVSSVGHQWLSEFPLRPRRHLFLSLAKIAD